MQKLQIQGASKFADRFFSECGPFQWAREFLQNSVEAKATKVEFGLEWQAVLGHKIYRRVISDDGLGMTPEELVKFFKTLGLSSKSTDGLESNYGIGAKIASLPWNPLGVTVISYAKRGEQFTSAMIRIYQDQDGDFSLHEFRDADNALVSHVDPDDTDWELYNWSDYNPDWAADNVDWSKVVPDWVKAAGHGTVVVLHGSKEFPHTMTGSNGKDITKGLSIYLNTRFWDFSSLREIKVAELKGGKEEDKWPHGPDDKDSKRSPNNRTIKGARHYIEEPYEKDAKIIGTVADSGVLDLSAGRLKLHWFLWEGERPKYGAYAAERGYVGLRYMNELYDTDQGKVRFRHFGIVESKVTDRLTIILEPFRAKKSLEWGVSPNQARSRLVFCDGDAGGLELPWSDWGREFYEAMPVPVRKAIEEARGEGQGELDDEAYRKRLQELFGDRWRVQIEVVKPGSKLVKKGSKRTVTGGSNQGGGGGGGGASTKPGVTVDSLGSDDGFGELGTALQAVSIPVYKLSNKDRFDKPWHLAMWVPVENAVYINTGSEILRKFEDYHVGNFPDVHEEEIRKVIRNAFGEIAVAKIAHSQQLKHLVNKDDLENLYRTPEALTIALMGYVSEDKYVALKLRKFGKASAKSDLA
jgi:hypothetical protein